MKTLKTCFFVLAAFSLVTAQVVHKMNFDRFSHYAADDWVTYAPATFITSIDIGVDYVYFGTKSGGILRYQLYDKFWDYPLTTSNGLRSNHIYKVVFDSQTNRLFVKTNKGVDIFTPGWGYFQPAYDDQLPARQRPDPEAVNTLKANRTFRFPEFYRPGNEELPDFFTPRGFSFLAPDNIVDPFNRYFHLNPERVVDRFSNLWFSTDGLGVAVSEVNSWKLQTAQHSIPNIAVRDLFLDKNGVWIGGLNTGDEPTGIAFWNDTQDTWRYFEARLNNNIISDNVYSVCGNERFIFFGTENGLNRYDKDKTSWNSLNSYARLSSARVFDLEIFMDNLYIATDHGLNILPLTSERIGQPEDEAIDNYTVFKILARDSTLLLATDYGVFEYDPQMDHFSLFKTRSALADYRITAIAENKNTLWLAASGGISFYDKLKDTWSSFTQLQYQLDAEYYDIVFTPGFVWVASNKGLLRYSTKLNNWYLYTIKDGLPSNKIYNLHPAGDYLWLCTERGMTIFRWKRSGRNE